MCPEEETSGGLSLVVSSLVGGMGGLNAGEGLRKKDKNPTQFTPDNAITRGCVTTVLNEVGLCANTAY